MTQYIEKDKIEEILRHLWKQSDASNPEHRICYNKALQEVQCKLDNIEVKEVDLEKEYARKDAFIEQAADYIFNNMRCDGYTLQTKLKFINYVPENHAVFSCVVVH